MPNDYHTQTELERTRRLRELLHELPPCLSLIHIFLRALDIFEEESVPARVLDFPDGMDPDEYIRTHGLRGIDALEPMDATAYRMKQESANHDLSTQEGRTAYAIACAKYLSLIHI